MASDPVPSSSGAGGAEGAMPEALPPGGVQPEGGDPAASGESEAVRTARAEAIKYRRLAGERESELKKLRDAYATDQDKAIAAARKEGADEAAKKYRSLLMEADVQTYAAGVLAHPEAAPRLLDLDTIEMNEDGRPSAKAVKAALEDLVKRMPELSAKPTPGNGQGFGGSADQGARATPANDPNAWVRGLARQQTGR